MRVRTIAVAFAFVVILAGCDSGDGTDRSGSTAPPTTRKADTSTVPGVPSDAVTATRRWRSRDQGPYRFHYRLHCLCPQTSDVITVRNGVVVGFESEGNVIVPPREGDLPTIDPLLLEAARAEREATEPASVPVNQADPSVEGENQQHISRTCVLIYWEPGSLRAGRGRGAKCPHLRCVVRGPVMRRVGQSPSTRPAAQPSFPPECGGCGSSLHGGRTVASSVASPWWSVAGRAVDDRVAEREIMIAFDWNGLRVGDRVLVHSDVGDFLLRVGRVASVHASAPLHEVGIRVLAQGGSDAAIVWPSRLQVHRDPAAAAERCWRCAYTSALG